MENVSGRVMVIPYVSIDSQGHEQKSVYTRWPYKDELFFISQIRDSVKSRFLRGVRNRAFPKMLGRSCSGKYPLCR